MSASLYASPSITVGELIFMNNGQPSGHLPASATSASSLPSDADAIHAITTGEGLRVVYQPQYDLYTMRTVSAEALLRWRHPLYGDVPPSVLIPMVNRLGLHLQLFNLVVTQVIDVLRCLRSIGADVPVAVNASVDTVCEPGMADLLSARMWDSCLSPRLLKVEMTEDLPVRDELCLCACLNALRAKGFPLSLDDFGAGSATLDVLIKMPFDEVKIDGAYIRDMETNTHTHAIVATIISLARRLDVKLVAEGIENETMVTSLRNMGCRTGQGYALSRPMERKDFLKHQLENNTAIALN
jgi:EAL domain-containing protein (putative c-di-GMP-specific phosphodiesterase class I)